MRLRIFLLVTGALLCLPIMRTALAADYRIERLSTRETHLEPGQSASYALRIWNLGTSVGVAHLGNEEHSDPPWLEAGYLLTQSSAFGCGDLVREYTGLFNFYRLVFDAGPIAPGQYLDCRITVFRDAASRHDMAMSWGVRRSIDPLEYDGYIESAFFGTLTDVSIDAHSSGFSIDDAGFAHATTELEIHNGGSMPVEPQVAGACEDNFLRPFVTDGSGPGGCGSDDHSPGCFDWGYGFLIPEVAAGDTYRCTIRLTSRQPYAVAMGFPIAIDSTQYGAGFTFMDIHREDNEAVLRLLPDTTNAVAAAVPSLAILGLIILGAALVLIAWRRSASQWNAP